MRMIFHIDMDAFFASIEIARNPHLKNKPVIIGGLPNERGVVSTCSYEARAFGVRSAMSLTEAYRRCPQAIFLEGNYSLYRSISEQVMHIFLNSAPHVEIVSIDEAYLDVTSLISNYQEALEFAKQLKQKILDLTKLTCSVGIASNKLLGKIASGFSKPNGLLLIPEDQKLSFMASLQIQTIPGIGHKTQEVLNRDGIVTVADLQLLGRDTLIERYGASGYYYYRAAMGVDEREVESEDPPPKSIGAETTFDKDESDLTLLMTTLNELAQKVSLRLRKYKMHTGGVTLKLRFSDFTTINRSRLLLSDTDNFHIIFEELMSLFQKNYPGTPLRLIGVSLERLKAGYWQPSLWDRITNK